MIMWCARAISPIIIYLVGWIFALYGRPCIPPPRSGRFEGVNRYVIALYVGKEPWEISQTVSRSTWMLRYWRDVAALHAKGERHTYVCCIYCIMPVIFEDKILFLSMTQKSNFFSFYADNNFFYLNNKFPLPFYYSTFIFYHIISCLSC